MNASLQTARQESVLRKMHLGTKSVFFPDGCWCWLVFDEVKFLDWFSGFL